MFGVHEGQSNFKLLFAFGAIFPIIPPYRPVFVSNTMYPCVYGLNDDFDSAILKRKGSKP